MNKQLDSNSKRIGPYLVKRLLGKGGMGMVYLAEDPQSKKDVAIKVLLPQVAEDTNLLDRFSREIDVLSKFHHPNIIQILAMGQEGDTRYYVMEYVRGKDIGVMIAEQGPLSWPIVLDYAMQICRGLRNAHDHGVVHRDLKPVNFLVDEQNKVKIADFGIARPWGDHGQTQTGSLLGTLAFMSPEQAEGKPVTNASDIYSLGASLYVMLTGSPPFAAPSIPGMLRMIVNEPLVPPRVRNPEIPVEFDELICELMEKVAENRPRSAYNVECKLKDITEVGQRRLSRKKNTTDRSGRNDDEKQEDLEERKPIGNLTVRSAETNIDSRDPKNLQPATDSRRSGKEPMEGESTPKSDQKIKDAADLAKDYGPTRDESRDSVEAEIRLRPVLDSNSPADETRIEDNPVSIASAESVSVSSKRNQAVSNSKSSYTVPVEQEKPTDWTANQKFFDARTVVLLIALVVVCGLAIWSSTWGNAEPNFSNDPQNNADAPSSFASSEDLDSNPDGVAISEDDLSPDGNPTREFVATPDYDDPVTAEYGNELKHVFKFFLTNNTSQPIASVKMLVEYLGEQDEVLARASVQTTNPDKHDSQDRAILAPNESDVFVEPQPLHIPAGGGKGEIEVPPGTKDVTITIQQVTFIDQTTWSSPDQ